MEKAMCNYKKISARECATRLTEIENPIVLIHVRPDGDAVGSASALCEIFRQLEKKAAILSADKIPERLKFILEHTKTELADTAEGKTAVSIDVASPAQLGNLTEKATKPSLMIDHHKVGEQFADGYIIPEASSAAEALLDVAIELERMEKIKINEPLAYALYAAISSDTGCFAYSNATPKTHRYAAMLMEFGIDSADINHRLFNSKSKEQIRAEGFISSRIETDRCGKIAYATLTIEDMSRLSLNAEHFDTAIDVVRALLGCEIAFIVKETEPKKYKVSLRSTGANVAEIAAKFGGGGHIRAAGCSITSDNIEQAKNIILKTIE